jgi:hypothetical protein
MNTSCSVGAALCGGPPNILVLVSTEDFDIATNGERCCDWCSRIAENSAIHPHLSPLGRGRRVFEPGEGSLFYASGMFRCFPSPAAVSRDLSPKRGEVLLVFLFSTDVLRS